MSPRTSFVDTDLIDRADSNRMLRRIAHGPAAPVARAPRKPRADRTGRARRAEQQLADRAALPVTETQAAVLGALSAEPQRPAEISTATGVCASSTAGALRSLATKGLATRLSSGRWVAA